MAWKEITLLQLEMFNFKRFYGFHKLDLLSEPEKPLILIGGNNGSGKTSIHEAINYALYEDDDLPGIQTRPSYLRAVGERLNRRALDEGSADFWVAIELLAKDGGARRRIRIERHWETNPNRQVKNVNLRIFENGRPVDFIEDDPAAYQDFLRSLLPPRIAPFFFFDGERIQQFADDENHESRMIDAIEDILHITVYKLLRDDLKKFVIDHIDKNEVKNQQQDDFYKLKADMERLREDIERKKDRLAEINRELGDLLGEQRRVEDELRRIASPYASRRDELLAEQARLNQELEQAKREMEEGFEPLPLLLSGELRHELLGTLLSEQESFATPEQLGRLRQQLKEMEKRLFLPHPQPPATIALSPVQLRFYTELYAQASVDVFGLAQPEKAILHDVGEAGRGRIMERLQEIEQKAVLLKDALNRRERLSNELRELQIKLQSTSEDPHVGELIERSKGINVQVGAFAEEQKNVKAEIQRLDADIAIRSRQIEDREERRKISSKAKQVIKVARGAQRVLDDFIKRLAPEKLELLQKYMNEMYGCLRKAEDPARRIDVDPETWQVILRDEKGRPLEKRVFSAGMKQMYALSLLWALSKASGRDFPIVIDTPVSRLDQENRLAIFEKYLPKAGHQVIVLSTDTELDVQWAKRLLPYVARQYRLDYDNLTDSSVIRPGYFF